MRQISVSTDVYAKIWSLRQPNEESEDAILHRVLQFTNAPEKGKSSTGMGVSDARYNVHFEEGFQISRRYLGVEFRATATGGQWHLENDNKKYGGLNELSRAVGAKTENAWMNWNYTDPTGILRKVSNLRDQKAISTRATTSPPKQIEESKEMPSVVDTSVEHKTWADDIVTALEQLGGRHAPLLNIYNQTRKVRLAHGRSVPATFEAVVRESLEAHSSDSDSFKGRRDLFCMPLGKGAGVWGLRQR